uniref:CC2-LZ domain-containing protein n=1 Tax=Steinernema glaseri TaxID=37863 RepID=A0A1I7Y8L4_9BILA
RIREADAVAELKEMRQKVMELETQNHVCTNQLKRQDDEVKRLREQFEQNQAKAEKWTHDQLHKDNLSELDDDS